MARLTLAFSLFCVSMLFAPTVHAAAKPQVYGDEPYRTEVASVKEALKFLLVNDGEWAIIVESREKWTAVLPHSLRTRSAGSCYTYVEKSTTMCNAEWLAHHGIADIARVLAHEYGHLHLYLEAVKHGRNPSIANDEGLAEAFGQSIRVKN